MLPLIDANYQRLQGIAKAIMLYPFPRNDRIMILFK